MVAFMVLHDLQQPPLSKYFDPLISVNSGQVFLWEKYGNSWYGIHGDQVIKCTIATDGRAEFSSFPEVDLCEYSVFRLDDDICKIIDQISQDSFVHNLVRLYPGLRLIRQEPHQCLFSFLCASNTNIPMIRRML